MLAETVETQFKRIFPQFAERLSQAGLSRLLKNCALIEFKAGRELFRDKMPTDGILFILSGEASIFVEDDEGHTVELGKVAAGHLLGEVSVLSRQMIASSTVQAITNVTALKLKHQPLERLLTSDDTGPALLELLSEILASRLRVAA
jgi:CRP/FNR family putative post-exponential-phase nitrogen-starvation transcriptional regulator